MKQQLGAALCAIFNSQLSTFNKAYSLAKIPINKDCLGTKEQLPLSRNSRKMSDSQKKYLKLALIAIYIAYCGITTFCIHTHIVNGVAYVHHHPNKSQDHGGNLAEIILLSFQCPSAEDVVIEELEISCSLKFIGEINSCRLQSTTLQKYTGRFFLRPPPVCVSF